MELCHFDFCNKHVNITSSPIQKIFKDKFMKYRFFILFCILGVSLNAQSVTVNGYVFETGNRGYLNQVLVSITNKTSGQEVGKIYSNSEGYFEIDLPRDQNYVAFAKKQLFITQSLEFTTKNVETGKKLFVKIQMEREPGYDFEVTLAPTRYSDDIPADAIRGAWIEVYNNTTKKEILNLKDHPNFEFDVHFDKGNHYTLMIRKEGFFTKRMEAYVNVEGCILCFEGVGSVQPGVVDNLTEGNEMGVLLANVELVPLFSGKTFEVKNIYYDYAKSNLRPEAKKALKGLATALKDNLHVSVELGSHTDSRGTTSDNQKLSEARAKTAVDYLVNRLDIPRNSIIAAGYGETALVNDCTDGVECSEEEHQQNRRTEITVLNITNKNRIQKTLAEIRLEEEFMRSVLQGEMETKVEKAAGVRGLANSESPVSDSEMQVVGEQTDQEKNQKIEEVVEKTAIKLNSRPSSHKTEDLNADNELPAKVIRQKQMPQVENSTVKGSVAEQRKRYNEMQKAQAERYKLGDYTGYKVVIQFSKDPISTDHEIYKKHENLVEYKASSGSMLYMIGDFKTQDEADDFVSKTASLMYPGAYVVQFENGRRLK